MGLWKWLLGAANQVPQGSTEARELPRAATSLRPITSPPKSSASRQTPHLDPATVQATLRVKAAREADPDRFSSKGNYGKTPLHTAAVEGNKDAVASLVANADMTGSEWSRYVNAKDIFGETALFKAAAQGHRNIVEWLLTYRADVNATDIEDKTPLHIAASKGDKTLAELLLANGADVNAKDARNATPLRWAIGNQHHDMAALLRRHGGHE